jgi:hypothetical protein
MITLVTLGIMLNLPLNFSSKLRHKSTICAYLAETQHELSFKPDLSNNTSHHMFMTVGSAVSMIV